MAEKQQSFFMFQQILTAPPPLIYQFTIHAIGGANSEEDYPVQCGEIATMGRILPISLLPPPIVISLPGYRKYEVKVPLKPLFAYGEQRGSDIRLESLLKRGYKVRISYDMRLQTERSNV